MLVTYVLPRPRSVQPRHKTGCGFTAVELLVVIAIVAVLASLAAPSFVPTIQRWQVKQAVEEMTASVYYARSEAIKRGGNVSVIRNSLTSTECPQSSADGDWACGWNVVLDSNNYGVQQGTEESVQSTSARSGVNIVNSATSNQNLFKVDRWGQVSGVGAQGFLAYPASAGTGSSVALRLCIGGGGRVQIIKGSESC